VRFGNQITPQHRAGFRSATIRLVPPPPANNLRGAHSSPPFHSEHPPPDQNHATVAATSLFPQAVPYHGSCWTPQALAHSFCNAKPHSAYTPKAVSSQV